MTSSIDTNLWISLWDTDANSFKALQAIDGALARGKVVVAGAVYAELMGGGGRSAEMLDDFFANIGILVDWRMDREVWQRAGAAYQGYVARRNAKKGGSPRGMLTDFLIGAHAVTFGYTLVTMDRGLFRAAFSELAIISA